MNREYRCQPRARRTPTSTRALDTDNLALIRTAASELPQVSLDDALLICLVIREREPELFDRAACRWLARYATDRRATRARG